MMSRPNNSVSRIDPIEFQTLVSSLSPQEIMMLNQDVNKDYASVKQQLDMTTRALHKLQNSYNQNKVIGRVDRDPQSIDMLPPMTDDEMFKM